MKLPELMLIVNSRSYPPHSIDPSHVSVTLCSADKKRIEVKVPSSFTEEIMRKEGWIEALMAAVHYTLVQYANAPTLEDPPAQPQVYVEVTGEADEVTIVNRSEG